MNRASFLPTIACGLFALVTGAKADPTVPDAPPVNPYIDTDGDGIPLAVLHPPPVRLSPEQAEESRKAQEKAVEDKNWLIRGYEQQLKAHATNDPTQDESSNLYIELSQNKELAKLAGIMPIDSSDTSTSPGHQADQSATMPDESTARSAAHTTPMISSTNRGPSAFGLKPLIAPLGAPDAAGLHNFYSSLPVAGAPAYARNNTSAPSAKSDASSDPADMETPGMIAAKNDPTSNLDTPDLTLDVLPGETMEQAKASRANNNNLELPQPMSADQLHKATLTATSVQGLPSLPGASAPKTPALPPVVNPVPDENATVPVREQPIIMPVHSPIADPYDILNR